MAFCVSEALGAKGGLAPSSLLAARHGALQMESPAPNEPSEAGSVRTPGPSSSPWPGADEDPTDTPSYTPPPPSPAPPKPAPPPPAPEPPTPTPHQPMRPLLVDGDGGRALYRLPNLGPGIGVSRCVRVTYRGPKLARVRLFASHWGTGLDRYLRVTVARGTARSTNGGRCQGFRPDRASYAGAGRGVLFRGRLDSFPETFEAAARLEGPRAWKNGETHTYRLRVALASANAAQGRSAKFELVWQARG